MAKGNYITRWDVALAAIRKEICVTLSVVHVETPRIKTLINRYNAVAGHRHNRNVSNGIDAGSYKRVTFESISPESVTKYLKISK